jgi:hypothetical protein
MIIYCFTSRSIIFHWYGDVTITGEGLQNLGLCSALRAFEQEVIFIMPHLLWHRGSRFFRSHPKDRPIQSSGACFINFAKVYHILVQKLLKQQPVIQLLITTHNGMSRIYYNPDPHGLFKGIVSKLTIKFWMCQKCSKMKDYNQKKKKWLQVL